MPDKPNPERIHRLVVQSAALETIQRIQRYLQADISPSKLSDLVIARGVAVRAMEDLASLLRDDVVLVIREEAEATNLSEQQLREKVAALEAEITASKAKASQRMLRKLRKLDVKHIP